MRISKNKLVKVHYTLYASGDDKKNELVEQTREDAPLVFIHGVGMMLEEFENNLLGLDEGEKFDFVLEPSEGYGEYSKENILELNKEVFYIDGKFDEQIVRTGAAVPMMDAEGHTIQGVVQEIKDDTVVMDFNHPLAGKSLNFKGHVESVTTPTDDEADALLHPHGGCGCGCGHDHHHDHSDCGCC